MNVCPYLARTMDFVLIRKGDLIVSARKDMKARIVKKVRQKDNQGKKFTEANV
jgi:hypothetical protein